MTYRRLLKYGVFILFVIGVGFAAVPFIKSMNPTIKAVGLPPKEVDVSHLSPGTYMMVELMNKPVVIYRTSEKSIKELEEINEKVWGPAITSKNASEYYVYIAVSTYLGCKVTDTKEVKYVNNFPPGWFDPCHMGVWDYAGRTYKHIYLPDDRRLPNLRPVKFTKAEDEVLLLQRN